MDARPGLHRVRSGRGFRYVNVRGAPVRDATRLRRIEALAIPPAWRDVWICSDPRGHLQATGRDARGRKQYRYHRRWREVRDTGKFERMLAFGRALPAIRRRVAHALALRGLQQAKVVATIVRLLEETSLRVGNEEYARQNHSYGLTTLRDGHVAVARDALVFEFRGKLGRWQRCRVHDPRVARIVARCRALPGAELFQYVDARGRRHRVSSTDVNDFLRDATGEDFSAKDFRTWAGSLCLACALRATRPAAGVRARRRQVLAALDEVAALLHNTRAVCRSSYVHPALIEAFERGALRRALAPRGGRRSGKSAEERALLAFLGALKLPAPHGR
jgi:DNA topoisomerase-1